MYPLLLIITALFILTLFSSNWPAKLYHHHLMKKIGSGLGVEPVRQGLFGGGVYSEIRTMVAGKELCVRFLEGSIDSLYAHSGLEIRYPFGQDIILQFYRSGSKMRPWGEFRQIFSGEKDIDSQWTILSDQPEAAGGLWRIDPIKALLALRRVEQILIQPGELIVRLKRGEEVRTVFEVVNYLKEVKKETGNKAY